MVGARAVSGSPVNSLSLCVRGHYGQDALSAAERLAEPLVREGTRSFREVSWNEALGEIAGRLGQVIEDFGPDSVGIIVSAQCSNEEIYLVVKLARAVLQTPHIDSIARFTSGPVVDGLAASMSRIRPLEPLLKRIQEAETIILMGARPDYTHPVVARNVRRAVSQRGAALVQLDPVTTSLSSFARIRWRERMDELPLGLAQLMTEIVSANLHDETFVLNNVFNAEEFISDLRGQLRGVPVRSEIKQVARLIGKGRKSIFLFGSRVARATQGYILSRFLVDLALLCGQPDNVLFLFEGCNEVGAWELGCAPDRLPGSLVSMDREALEFFRNRWSRPDMTLKRGLDAMGMIRAAERGELKALLFLGVDPLAVFPDSQRTQKALSLPDLVVRTGMFRAIGEETAHIVFPTAAITETDGTYVSTEGRVQRVSKLSDPPGTARPTARFILDLAGMLGYPLDFVSASDVFEEITRTCLAWSSLTWEAVGKVGGVLLGHPENDGGYAKTCSGRKWVAYPPPDSFAAPPQPPPGRPWKVYPEAQTAHPGDGVVSGRSPRLARMGEIASVRMNPNDMQRVGAKKGSWIRLGSEVGEVKARVIEDVEVPASGLVIPAAGPRYIFQRLLPWPEEYCPAGWDRIYVSVSLGEEG